MSGKMLVLFAKWTGHVLSAATVTAIPTTPLTADTLAGTALPLRNVPGNTPTGDWRLALPSGELDVALVNMDEQLLADPFSYEIGSDKQSRMLQHLGAKLKIAAPTSTSLAVTLPLGLLAANLHVLVGEEGVGSDIAEVQQTTTDNLGVATITTTVAGTRTVLALIAGYPLVVKTV